jgi:serine/threonine protein kinase
VIANLPAQIGPYRIEGEIGRGGMGVVLRAHDDVFHRSLAVKVLLANPADHPDQVMRFLEEAQVRGQLQHPGIAPLHTLGWLPDGRPYFSMKLIRGHTLAQLLRERSSGEQVANLPEPFPPGSAADCRSAGLRSL